MKPFVIFGDSLAVAYSEAAELRTDGMFVGGPLMGGRRFYDRHAWVEDGRLQVSKAFKPAYERFLTAAGETSFEDCVGRIVISLGMTSGPVFNGVDRFNGSHWSVFHRGAEPGGSKFYLSDGALRRIMADAQANILSIYEHGLARGLFAAAFAPPPPPDHLSDKYGAHLVHEIARYVEEPIRKLLAAHGVPLVEVKGTTTQTGGLKKKYVGVDGFHGNVEYAGLVLDKALEVLDSREPAHA